MQRGGLVVAGALVLAAVLGGCTAAEASSGVAVEAYVEPGSGAAARVSDAAPRSATVGIDGVTLTDDGAGLHDVPEGVGSLARASAKEGASPELLVSNYSDRIGDFSPAIGTALLGDAGHRTRVAKALAAVAAGEHMRGVQIDLESLRARDRAGLVAFAAALSDAVHERLGRHATVSMAVMASTTADGYRDTGYDLRGLAGHVDRFVLMTYDQHGPWSGPGTVGALPWTKRVVTAAEHQGLPARRIDLGIAGYGYVWGGSGDPQVSPASAARTAGRAARWSPTNGEWSAELDDGRELHWSDARSYRARVALAEDLGLHGVALWSINTLPLPS